MWVGNVRRIAVKDKLEELIYSCLWRFSLTTDVRKAALIRIQWNVLSLAYDLSTEPRKVYACFRASHSRQWRTSWKSAGRLRARWTGTLVKWWNWNSKKWPSSELTTLNNNQLVINDNSQQVLSGKQACDDANNAIMTISSFEACSHGPSHYQASWFDSGAELVNWGSVKSGWQSAT